MVRALPRSSNIHLQGTLGQLAPRLATCPEAVVQVNRAARSKVQAAAATIRADLSQVINNIQVLILEEAVEASHIGLLKEAPQTSNLLIHLLLVTLLSKPNPPQTEALLHHPHPTSKIR